MRLQLDALLWRLLAPVIETAREEGREEVRASVRELHSPFEWSFGCGPVKSCRECARRSPQEDAEYPCPTIRALGGAL